MFNFKNCLLSFGDADEPYQNEIHTLFRPPCKKSRPSTMSEKWWAGDGVHYFIVSSFSIIFSVSNQEEGECLKCLTLNTVDFNYEYKNILIFKFLSFASADAAEKHLNSNWSLYTPTCHNDSNRDWITQGKKVSLFFILFYFGNSSPSL